MQPIIIAQVLADLKIRRPQTKFLQTLLSQWLTVQGRFNFVNLGRYFPCHERTLRRWFARSFAWEQFNGELLGTYLPAGHELILALDNTFIPKSGRKTPGLGFYFNGSAQRMMPGMEASVVSVVDVTASTAYALEAMAMPPSPRKQQVEPKPQSQTRAEGKKPRSGRQKRKFKPDPGTRFDVMLNQLQRVLPQAPSGIRYLAVDGAFTACPFVNSVRALELHVVGRLRHNMALHRPYNGPQGFRGRPRLSAGRISCSQPESQDWIDEGWLEHNWHLTSARVYSPALALFIKVARLEKLPPDGKSASGTRSYALLFSTDVELSGKEIVRLYSARFQIEFLFRDAKGATGLNDCQSRSAAAIHFHWNASLSAVNLAKLQAAPAPEAPAPAIPSLSGFRFSIASRKRICANTHLLQTFTSGLGLDWNFVKSHPNFHSLVNYGCILY